MTVYGYARVSVREPEDKNLDLQMERLVRAGCPLGNIRAEEASGAKNDRGGLLELLDLVVEGDTLVVTHIDRLSRGLTYGLQVIKGLHRTGVEFRYPLETMLELHRQHESVILLDHHETARDALEGRMPDCHFDLERSGVTIAWEYWGSGFGTNEGEMLARYIEDRDLWRWKLPDSREVSAALDSTRRGSECGTGWTWRPWPGRAREFCGTSGHRSRTGPTWPRSRNWPDTGSPW